MDVLVEIKRSNTKVAKKKEVSSLQQRVQQKLSLTNKKHIEDDLDDFMFAKGVMNRIIPLASLHQKKLR